MAFETIIGNDEAKELLKETINSKAFLHSYLFTGIDGIGKLLFAKEFAKNILCENQTGNNSFEQFESGNHPDFGIISPDGNSIKIEQIRFIQNKIVEKPVVSNRKVYIINDSQTMTKEAQNCLLKTLEEPPEYMIIILICSNEEQLLNTIKSRCTKVLFKPIPDKELKEYMSQKGIDQNLSNNIFNVLDGSIGKLFKILDKKEILKEVEPIFNKIEENDKVDMLKNADILYKYKDDIVDILNYGNVILFEKSKKDRRYLNCIKMLEKAKTRLKQNANYDMTIDNMLFSIWEEINENNNRS